jgi:hypothetical protein
VQRTRVRGRTRTSCSKCSSSCLVHSGLHWSLASSVSLAPSTPQATTVTTVTPTTNALALWYTLKPLLPPAFSVNVNPLAVLGSCCHTSCPFQAECPCCWHVAWVQRVVDIGAGGTVAREPVTPSTSVSSRQTRSAGTAGWEVARCVCHSRRSRRSRHSMTSNGAQARYWRVPLLQPSGPSVWTTAPRRTRAPQQHRGHLSARLLPRIPVV